MSNDTSKSAASEFRSIAKFDTINWDYLRKEVDRRCWDGSPCLGPYILEAETLEYAPLPFALLPNHPLPHVWKI